MAVEKAAVDENDRPPAGQDYVRRPRQVTLVQAEPQAQSVQRPSHNHLRFCVAAADRGHIPAASVRDVAEVGPLLALAWFCWHCPAMDIRDEAVRQDDGTSDRRWVLVMDDGTVSTLGRATDPTEEELARVEEMLAAQGVGGWLAIQSHSAYRGPPPPTFVEVRRVGSDGKTFEDVVASVLARSSA